MLQLRSSKICDEFKVNKKLYSNRISSHQEKELEYIENLIESNDSAFLSDPEYWISRWEDITGDEMPQKYINDIPREITGTAIKVKRNSPTVYLTHFLPVINQKGERISYPVDRRVREFGKTYILNDKLVSKLTA